MALGILTRRSSSFVRSWKFNYSAYGRGYHSGSKILGLDGTPLLSEEWSHSKILGPDGLPISVDWRKEGAVTAVQNQGDCGGCWAYSVTAAVESLNFIKTKKLIKLSEQHLLDCVNVNCFGCEGGHEIPGLDYIIMHGGQVSLEDYTCIGPAYDYVNQFGEPITPEDYDAYAQVIPNDAHMKIEAMGVTIGNFAYHRDVPDRVLKKWLTAQPVIVVIAADHCFEEYEAGDILRCPGYEIDYMIRHKLDHSALLVAYTEDLWIGKNCWGEKWGDGGYFSVARHTEMQNGGVLGINRFVIVPLKFNLPNNLVRVRPETVMRHGWKEIPNQRRGFGYPL